MGFSIVAKFGAQDGMTTVFDRMAQAGNRFSSKTGRGFDSVNGHVDALKNKVGALKNILIGSVAGYFSVEGLKTLGGGIIKATADFEMFRTSFETLLRNKGKGDAFFESIKKFSTVTPFQVKDLSDASKQLLAFGFTADTVLAKERKLADLSMGDLSHFSQLVYAYGKTKSIGITSAREMRMFTSAGVNMYGALAAFKHTTTQQIQQMVKEKKITFSDIDDALTRFTSKTGMFYNMTNKQAHTLKGLWTTSQDILVNMGDTIGNYNGHLTSMKGGLTWFISHQDDVMKDVLKVCDVLDKGFEVLSKVFSFTVKIFKEVHEHWSLISPIVWGVVGAFGAYKLAMVQATVWTGISNTLFAGETIPILTALQGGYYKAAFAQMALNTGINATALSALKFAGTVGLCVIAFKTGWNLGTWMYKSFQPVKTIVDDLDAGLIRVAEHYKMGNFGKIATNTLKGQYSQDMHYDIGQSKFLPNKGKEWEFTKNNKGYYIPKPVKVGEGSITSGSKTNGQKTPTVVLNQQINFDNKGKPKVKTQSHARFNHSLKTTGAYAQ